MARGGGGGGGRMSGLAGRGRAARCVQGGAILQAAASRPQRAAAPGARRAAHQGHLIVDLSLPIATAASSQPSGLWRLQLGLRQSQQW